MKEKIDKSCLQAKKGFEFAGSEYYKAKDDYRQGRLMEGELKISKENMDKAENRYLEKLARNYRYIPNFRTIVLYLYNEYYDERKDIRRIKTGYIKSCNNKISPILAALGGI